MTDEPDTGSRGRTGTRPSGELPQVLDGPASGRPAGPSTGASADSSSASPAGVGVLVIGIGNDLRGDDGVGFAVVEELNRRAVPGLQARWSHQLVPELAEPISRAARVVFVDAAVPGDARVPTARGGPDVEVLAVPPSAPALGGHQAGPGALLGLAALAGLPVPEAFVISVRARDLGLGGRLSLSVRAAVDVAVRAVLQLAAPDAAEPSPVAETAAPGTGTGAGTADPGTGTAASGSGAPDRAPEQ